MRLTIYEDENGWLRQSWVKDGMSSLDAHKGVPCNPPDLAEIDCVEMMKELNNLLVQRGLISLDDLQAGGYNLLRSAVQQIVTRRISNMYKENK